MQALCFPVELILEIPHSYLDFLCFLGKRVELLDLALHFVSERGQLSHELLLLIHDSTQFFDQMVR